MILSTAQNLSKRDALVEFFRAVLPAPAEGQVLVAAMPYPKKNSNDKPAMQHTYAASQERLADELLTIGNAGNDTYFALARFNPHKTNSGNFGRQGAYAHAVKSYWVDIDCGHEKAAAGVGYSDKKEGVTALFQFVQRCGLPAPSHIVDSGGGVHAYWALDREIRADEWKLEAVKFKALADAFGFLADPSRTADVASVMRAPFTQNHKLATPRDVKLKRGAAAVPFSVFAGAIDTAFAKHCTGLAANARHSQPDALCNLAPTPKAPPPPETTENHSLVKAMLATIPADCDYEAWRTIVWSVAASGWTRAEALAREWSRTAPDRFDEAAFQSVWKSFDSDGGIGFGTLVHHAKLNGFQPEEEHATGDGGDVENGRLFADTWRDKLLFVHETGDVLRFDDVAGWISASPGEADRAAKLVLDKMCDEAAAIFRVAPVDPKTKRLMAHVTRTNKAPNLRAMVEMAASEAGMTRSLNEFDSDAMQLGVTNGVLAIDRRQLLSTSPVLLVTKRCRVDYVAEATCPQWQQFLVDVQPDQDVREFLQRWVGYCLTGGVREHKFVFLHGSGGNGKSVFVELIAWLLGDYAKKIATEMLMHHQRSPQAASPDIVSLKGMRFVYANETEEGRKLAEAKVKEMTGGDTLTGRVPYGKADITFVPTHKLAIVGNHRPEIGDTSHGMWRRVCLIPFDVTIPVIKCDPKLLEKLKKEGPGILNWALQGFRKYQQGGLAIPRKIEAATAAYRDEQDSIGEWIRDHCITGPGLTTKKDEGYRAYRAWAIQNGHHPLANVRLTRRLGERGYRLLADKRNIGGIALNQAGAMAAQQ